MQIDEELNFEDHILGKVSRANTIAGLIRIGFLHLDTKLFEKLFTTFVRPPLEYCAAVWSPCLMKHVKRPTDSAISIIPKFVERLSRLESPTLAFRRQRSAVIWFRSTSTFPSMINLVYQNPSNYI